MDLSTGIAAISLLRQAVQDRQPSWRSEAKGLDVRFLDATSAALAQHHTAVVQWAAEAHGFPSSTSLTAPTIDLSFSTIPRRLGQGKKEIDELDILLNDRHVTVLGDPGAGKTTTLRRLANHVALNGAVSLDDYLRFVILVVCREEQWATGDVLPILRGKVGISGRLFAELDDANARLLALLDSGALILIDGLDEVPSGVRQDLDQSLVALARHLASAKVVVSCRSGDFHPLEQFDTAEILPLSEKQIADAAVAILGAGEGSSFMDRLGGSDNPSFELADRPLFLGHMAMLFRARGDIPDRPAELYEAITNLAIKEWDEHRRVRRPSKYARFSVDDKRRFLADMSLELLLRRRQQFSHADLTHVYSLINDRYRLPPGQAASVARELESHTGIIQQVGTQFEFSHLSLQEYLAADAFVRSGSRLRQRWMEVPAVAAVSIALASDANDLFLDLVEALPRELEDNRPIQSFLNRLAIEQPRFVASTELGMGLLQMLSRGRIARLNGTRMFKGSAVPKSLMAAIDTFHTVTEAGASMRFAKLDKRGRVFTAMSVSAPVLRILLSYSDYTSIQKRGNRPL